MTGYVPAADPNAAARLQADGAAVAAVRAPEQPAAEQPSAEQPSAEQP
jgi:hypothetical protein